MKVESFNDMLKPLYTHRGTGWYSRYRDPHGPEIESQCGRNFPHPSGVALGSTQPPVQYVTGLYVGGKPTVTWRWQTAISSAELKKTTSIITLLPLWGNSPCIHLSLLWEWFKDSLEKWKRANNLPPPLNKVLVFFSVFYFLPEKLWRALLLPHPLQIFDHHVVWLEGLLELSNNFDVPVQWGSRDVKIKVQCILNVL